MNRDESTRYARDLFERSVAVKQAMTDEHFGQLAEMAEICIESIEAGGKIMFCGNGGSAADAQHLAAELLVRLRPNVNRSPIPAIALAMDTSSLTACGNDYSYEAFFERMVQGLGRKGDVLVGITTSGRSQNVIRAFKAAQEIGVKRVAFLGGDGGPALAECDVSMIAPSSETGRIQEVHITAGHTLMELIEEGLLAHGSIEKV